MRAPAFLVRRTSRRYAKATAGREPACAPPHRRGGGRSWAGMTGLLAPAAVRRPRSASVALAGAASAGLALLGCLLVAVVGWYATDAGAHGTTNDALRVGADAWLL